MKINTLYKYILDNISIICMCPMASLTKLFPDPCKSMWNSSMVFKWRKDFPSKNNIWQPYWIFYCLSFSNLSKCLEEDPKLCILIIH